MKIINKMLLTLGLVGTLGSLSSCTKVDTSEVSIILPNGTPALAMGTLLNDVDAEVVTDSALLQTALVTGKTDFVIAPLILGTKLFVNSKSSYILEAVITTNNAYLVSNNELTPASLQGKEIVGFQKTNTPGIMLETYLEMNNISASVQYEANVNQSVAAFKNSSTEYALVAEPQLTQLEQTYPNLNVLNIGEEICEKGEFIPQAALFINPNSVNDEDCKAFMKNLNKNIERLNRKSKGYAEELIESEISYFKNYSVEVLTKALPRCNLAYKRGIDNIESISNYYESCDKYSGNATFNGLRPNENFFNK